MSENHGRSQRPSPQRSNRGRSYDRGRRDNVPSNIDTKLLADLEREEPLSIAEELDIAAERVRRFGKTIEQADNPDNNVNISAMPKMSMPELMQVAEE
ncbi:MAG: hypothetical protein RID07_00395, partial [Lacipirellulaceae bacterium]